jgi:hypothetical protein
MRAVDTLSVLIPVGFMCACVLSVPVIFGFLGSLHETMQAVADKLGLSYRGPLEERPERTAAGAARGFLRLFEPWRLVGNVAGVFVAVFPLSRGKSTYSVVDASFPRPLGFSLRVGRETLLDALGRAVAGLQDIQTGDQVFDEAMRVQAANSHAAAVLLAHEEVRRRILAAQGLPGSVVVTEKSVRWEKRGTVRDADLYRGVLDLVLPVVHAIVSASPTEATASGAEPSRSS